MVQQLAFGSVIHLQNQAPKGGHLGISESVRNIATLANYTKSVQFVTTHGNSNEGFPAGTIQWVISSATGKPDGDPVLVGDTVFLKNAVPDGGYLDTCGWVNRDAALAGPQNAYADKVTCGVFTAATSNRDKGTGTWRIGKDGAAPGQGITDADVVTFENGFTDPATSAAGFLVAYGDVSDREYFTGTGPQVQVYSSTVAAVVRDSGRWAVTTHPAAREATGQPATSWTGVEHTGSDANDTVAALLTVGAETFVGGFFQWSGPDGGQAHNIARYSDALHALANGGLDGSVSAFAVAGDQLYVGGDFTATSDGAVSGLHNIARYSIPDNTWHALTDDGLTGSGGGEVTSLAVAGGYLYAGGSFERTGKGALTGLQHVVRYSLTDGSVSTPGGGLNAKVHALLAVGADLYAGGEFTGRGGEEDATDLMCVARYTAEKWSALGGGLPSVVTALAADAGGTLYAGGAFQDGPRGLCGIARYAGGQWSGLPGGGLDSNASALVPAGDGLYLGGSFQDTADGTYRPADGDELWGVRSAIHGIVRYTGGQWVPLPAGGLVSDRANATGGSVTALATRGADLIAGGEFDGTTRAGSAGTLHSLAVLRGAVS